MEQQQQRERKTETETQREKQALHLARMQVQSWNPGIRHLTEVRPLTD